MGAPLEYNKKYHLDWAWSLYAKGATDQEVADSFGVSVRTIHRWKKDHPEFAEVVLQSKEVADAKVERSLYQLATGCEYTNTDTEITIDKDGNQKPAKIKKTTVQAKPDTGAVCFWLKNRKPQEWRDRREEVIITDIDQDAITDVESFINGTYRESEESDTTASE